MIPRLALTACILVLALLVLGAYLRHSQVGSGCSDWPDCYGNTRAKTAIPPINTRHEPAANTQPLWARRAHRAVAGSIAVVVISLAVLSVATRRRGPVLVFSLLALATLLFLVALGLWGGSSRTPLVTIGNLLGGVALLGVLWWLFLTTKAPATAAASPTAAAIRPWLGLGLVLMIVETALGAVTSASYGALSCTGLIDCGGTWWPDTALGDALSSPPSSRPEAMGGVVVNGMQRGMHIAHRVGAVLVLVWGASLAWGLRAAPERPHLWRAVLASLIAAQVALGIGIVMSPSTLTIALGHSVGASLLLVALLRVFHHHPAARRAVSPSPWIRS